jgi:lactam utilization protein B
MVRPHSTGKFGPAMVINHDELYQSVRSLIVPCGFSAGDTSTLANMLQIRNRKHLCLVIFAGGIF